MCLGCLGEGLVRVWGTYLGHLWETSGAIWGLVNTVLRLFGGKQPCNILSKQQ